MRVETSDAGRRITSPITAMLLLRLERGCATIEELSRVVMQELGMWLGSGGVSPYLAYLKRRGLVVNDSPLWCLSEEGRRYIDAWRNHLLRVVSTRIM